jgi:hypothetical protein
MPSPAIGPQAWLASILDSNGKDRRGLGILIRPGYIVTCAHVVARALGKCDEIDTMPTGTVTVEGLKTGQRATARVIGWFPADSTFQRQPQDICLLSVDGAGLPVPAWAELMALGPRQHSPINVFGLPNGPPGVLSEGSVLVNEVMHGWWQVAKPKDPPPGYTPIGPGFSGSLAWDAAQNKPVGMVVAMLKDDSYLIPLQSVLEACKLKGQGREPLLHPPTLETARVLPEGSDREALWADQTVELLSGVEVAGLLGLLSENLRLLGATAEAVVESMRALPHAAFVSLGNVVCEALVGDGTKLKRQDAKLLAPRMEAIVESGLVVRLGAVMLARLILQSHGGMGGGLVRLPCVYPLMAEFFNAGLDDRDVDLTDIPPAKRKGAMDLWKEVRQSGYEKWPTLCIPMEPKHGFGKDPLDRARSILGHLILQFRIPGDLPEEEKFKRANARLHTLAEPAYGKGARWFYLFTSDGRDESMQKLGEVLPALRLCALESSQSIDDEEELMAELRDKFYVRKRKRVANA